MFSGWVIIAIVVAIILQSLYATCMNWVTRKQRFIEEFADQRIVDLRLQTLANELKRLFDEQVTSQREIANSDLATREHTAKTLADKIAKQKEKFWNAVDLAKRMGFLTPTTFDGALKFPIKKHEPESGGMSSVA